MSIFRRITGHPITHAMALTIIVWMVFSRTLGSYFLADDFGEVSYASRIFDGNYELLWANFTSNYMQIPGMAVWRPWLMVSLFTDFCLWRGNSLGYFLTNLLSYNLVVVLFYLLIYSLTNGRRDIRGKIVALLAAATFAVSPLHCESISWVVGRVDIVCAVFYLACLNLSLFSERAHSQNRRTAHRTAAALAVICFWLGMWTKEMAIGAPLMVSVMILLFGQKPLNWKHTLRHAAPLWLSIFAYFCLRYLVLGTLLGGYVQGIGDSQAANALSRWLDPDTLRRLFFPFVYSIFGNHSWQQTLLQFFYVTFFVLILTRVVTFTISLRWACFLTVWALTCLAPLYKLWGMGYELEGARFCFFLTMPLSLLAPSLALIGSKRRILPRRIDAGIGSIGIIASLSSILILGKAAYLSNLVWVHAGQEVRELARQARIVSSSTKGEQRLLVLGIPKRLGGAHMVLNGATFVTALRPPFTHSDFSFPFTTFDPIQFAECPYINSDRFKRLVAEGGKVIVWDSTKRRFRNVTFSKIVSKPTISLAATTSGYTHHLGGATPSIYSKGQIAFNNIIEGDSIAFTDLNLNPLAVDYLEAHVCVLDKEPRALNLALSLDDKSKSYYQSNALKDNNKEGILRIPLSRNWRWFDSSNRDSLYLLLPPGRKIALSNCRFVSTTDVAPIISISNGIDSYEGVTSIHSSQLPESQLHGNRCLNLNVSLPPLPNLSTMSLEISKANSFYENFPENDGNAAVKTRLSFPLSSNIKIPCENFAPGCYHQIRLRLLDKTGASVGELSCPITVQL